MRMSLLPKVNDNQLRSEHDVFELVILNRGRENPPRNNYNLHTPLENPELAQPA
jgi:hypothetical protein